MKTARLLIAANLLVGSIAAGHAGAVAVYGLGTDNTIVRFDSAAPGTILGSATISGASASGGSVPQLIGIDFRPANNVLYGASAAGELFTINPLTGSATSIGISSIAPSGSSFGFDFNPAADRLRIVSNTDQSLRINVDNRVAISDGALNYGPADPSAGFNPTVVGSAYTNSFAGTLTTQLFGIDSDRDTLVLQNPPNAGTLVTIGSLNFDTGTSVGFDIFAEGNQGFAALTPENGFSSFFGIDLATGSSIFLGRIGSDTVISDIAVAQVPEPETVLLFSVGLLGLLAARRRKHAKAV
ncbi:MAG: DUF4394 domain-containing protein [Pseudomonadota bacterium]